jgi:hypothetical protein
MTVLFLPQKVKKMKHTGIKPPLIPKVVPLQNRLLREGASIQWSSTCKLISDFSFDFYAGFSSARFINVQKLG